MLAFSLISAAGQPKRADVQCCPLGVAVQSISNASLMLEAIIAISIAWFGFDDELQLVN
jgi:hypothetical protein